MSETCIMDYICHITWEAETDGMVWVEAHLHPEFSASMFYRLRWSCKRKRKKNKGKKGKQNNNKRSEIALPNVFCFFVDVIFGAGHRIIRFSLHFWTVVDFHNGINLLLLMLILLWWVADPDLPVCIRISIWNSVRSYTHSGTWQ